MPFLLKLVRLAAVATKKETKVFRKQKSTFYLECCVTTEGMCFAGGSQPPKWAAWSLLSFGLFTSRQWTHEQIKM